ncbi:DNA polymerase III subunit beta [Oscillospiraceae bacterium LTW-04]|nr:DNA polymerase III subunit beta [Oscillospiraceae bacterium MB24-C1]
MRIKCEKTILCDAASVVSRAVSSRSPLPTLEGILIRTADNAIELFGYDLDIGISTKIDAQIEAAGEIVLPAKVLLDIVKKLPGEFVTITVGEKCLTEIKSGFSEFTILGMPADEFPEFPSIGEVTDFSVTEDVLKSMIDQTIFAISQSDAKPIHTGSLFEIKSGSFSVVSIDGYRLALRNEKVSFDSDISFVIPGRALNEVSRILSESSDELVGMQISKKHIVFHIGDFQVFSRLLEGDFLDYNAAIPKTSSTTVKINTREFIEAVERVSLLISDRIKSPLRIKFVEDEIILNCSTALGRAVDTVAASIEGGTLEMGFNNRYLLDALRAAQCDEVCLEISGPLSPMKVVPINSTAFVFLVLPVRLKSEM